MALNWIDWITVAIVLVSILRGSRHGVLAGLLDLAVLIASFFAASAAYTRGAQLLQRVLIMPPSWEALTAFVLIWLLLYIPSGILIRSFMRQATSTGMRVAGGLLGGIRGLAVVTVLLVIMLAAPLQDSVKKDVRRSQVAPYLLRGYDRVMSGLLPVIPVRVPRIGPGGRQF